jgi:shikimate dehydrogenase
LKTFALIGKQISYSYSKIIHEYLINYFKIDATYELISIDNINNELLNEYDGCNITIPYKEEVTTLVDNQSNLKMINTILNKDHHLLGYNTDLAGFDYLINNSLIKKILPDIKTIVILGSGATSKMIQYYFKDKDIKIISSHKSNYTYDMLDDIKGDLLINTTPVGMNEYQSLLKDKHLYNYHTVIDLNYNPLNSKLKYQANLANTYYINGLDMLIVQAIKAFEIWHNINAMFLVEDIKKEILLQTQHKIALIGFPLSGKTTLIKEFNGIDLDEEIIKEYGSIDTLIKKKEFRIKESIILNNLINKNTKLLACGGGIVLNSDNMVLLKDYLIIYVKESKYLLKKRMENNYRPLLTNKNSFDKMYYKRKKLYEKYASITMNYEQTKEFLNEFKKRNKN